MGLIDFKDEEIDMLVGLGFVPGFMGDVRIGDVVAVPPVTRFSFSENEPEETVKTFVVTRVVPLDASYWEPELDELVQNTVMTMITTDLDGRPKHESYGSTYPVFYKREEM